MYSSVASSIAPERPPTKLHFLKKFYANENFTADTGQFTSLSIGTAGSFAVTGGQGVITNSSGSAKDRYVKTGTAPTITTFVQITVAARTGSPSTSDIVGIGIIKDSSNLILFEYDRVAAVLRFTVRVGGSTTIKGNLGSVTTINTSYKIGISIYKNRLTGFIDSGNAEGWDQKITTDITALIDLTSTDLSLWQCGFGVGDSGSATATTTFDDFIAFRKTNYFDLQPSALITTNETFTTNTSQFTQFTAGSPGTFSFTGGKGQIVHGPTDGSTFEVIGSEVQMPQFFASLDVVSMTGSGRVSIGLVKDATHFVLVRYSTIDGNIVVRISDGVSNITTGISVSYTLPFKLGMSVVGNSCAVWVDIGNGWERVTGADSTATFDLKTIIVAGGGYKAAFALTSNGNVTLQVDNLVVGRFGGIALRDETPCTDEQGRPYVSGGLLYFTATASDTQEDIPNGGSYCGVFTLNLSTLVVSQTSVIMVNRSSKIQTDHAAHIIVYNNGDRRLLITTWGNQFDSTVNILHKLLSATDILNGTNIVASMTQLTLSISPPGSGGFYDPFLVKRGSTWYLAYTVTPFTATNFYLALDSSPDLVTWTAVRDEHLVTAHEGPKTPWIAGTNWILAAGASVSRIYDQNLNYIADLDASLADTNTFPHPCIIPNGTKQLLLAFDSVRYVPSLVFTWGHLTIHEAQRYK